MKKTLLIAAAVTLTAISSFAQGNILYSGGLSAVKQDTNGTPSNVAGMTVELFFSTGVAAPAVDGITATGLSTGANGGKFVGSTFSATAANTFSIASAWADILGDGNYFAPIGTNGVNVLAVSTGTGGWTYNGATSFSSSNVTGGTAYTAYLVGWAGGYATAALAAAAGAPVGWSQYFTYTPTSGNTVAVNTSTLEGAFGVFAPVPEPTTIALASLSGLSLLAFRRRNKKA
jgi:hypothetical protein